MKKQSRTKSFGSSERISHDATIFYESKMYKSMAGKKVTQSMENHMDESIINRIYNHSSEEMHELPDQSIHLMITSPPYNACKEYDRDLSLEEYLYMLEKVFRETYRVLVNGGRACINIANIGRKPYIPLHFHIIKIMMQADFMMRGEIIWDKSAAAGASCAWGSFCSASNPVLRDIHEYILIFSKGDFSRKKTDMTSTITNEEFVEYTKSIWRMQPVSAKRTGHPAPFPEELSDRLIKLYCFRDDVVLDPFCGSGTALASALKLGRRYIGYETEKEYVILAETRTEDLKNSMSNKEIKKKNEK
ncbi:MAG: site-specific DNA-methyltransferase [Candidatus Coatesbacteria bacterium]|nr:site-specific DNA-methyltransferase [Candidatus Coatesbacteria bacterium]